ncbi:MAG: serine/threonine-protein kinase [Gemmatimonadales bacterium]
MDPLGSDSQTALPQALAEALRDRYVLEREIAQGGMATVYLGREVGGEQRVAIKVMHPEVATIIGAERFRREIEIVRGMSHPGIVPLTDFGSAADLLFYVMPYIDGESVYERVQREGRFPLTDALRITHEIAQALGHAHSRGVLHRDVKPENILLAGYSARAGGAATSWHALVADFGLARAIGAADYQRLTETGVIVGTVFYMSPEQLKEDRSLDQRADIYSLGCILFEMLTGAPPYTGSSISDIVRRILRGPTPSAARMNREVPPEVELAVSRALARSPAERFQSMREFADALAPKGLAGSSNDAPPGWFKL